VSIEYLDNTPALAGLFFLLVPKCGVGFRELSGVPVASGDQ
jgi:hypothetical protein